MGSKKEACRVDQLFKLFSKAHMLDILYLFSQAEGPLRFVDIQERLHLSPNTLSDRLRTLVDNGFLTRTSYNEIPPRVDYEATPSLHDLGGLFDELGDWADSHALRPA